MPQKSKFVEYPAFTFESAAFGRLLADRMSVGMLQEAAKALAEAGISDPVDVVNLLISRLVETEGGVDLTQEMAGQLSPEERETFCERFIEEEGSVIKRHADRKEGETATQYVGSRFPASVAKLFSPPSWMKGHESFLGAKAMGAITANSELISRISGVNDPFKGIKLPSTAFKDMRAVPDATKWKYLSAENILPTIPKIDYSKIKPESRITNEKLEEVVDAVKRLAEIEGQSTEVITNIGIVADRLFQQFTESAETSRKSTETNLAMAKDTLQASKRAVGVAVASVIVTVLIAAAPALIQWLRGSEVEKQDTLALQRVLNQIDQAKTEISGTVSGSAWQARQSDQLTQQRLDDILMELRSTHSQQLFVPSK